MAADKRHGPSVLVRPRVLNDDVPAPLHTERSDGIVTLAPSRSGAGPSRVLPGPEGETLATFSHLHIGDMLNDKRATLLSAAGVRNGASVAQLKRNTERREPYRPRVLEMHIATPRTSQGIACTSLVVWRGVVWQINIDTAPVRPEEVDDVLASCESEAS